MEVDSQCGPRAPCKARIEAMVAAHRTALQELQDKHDREIRELEAHRDRLLQDEIQGSSRGEGTLRGCVVKLGGLYYGKQTTVGIVLVVNPFLSDSLFLCSVFCFKHKLIG